MSADFHDHFSGHADEYAAARPTYPVELFDYLARLSPSRRCAWDCATGSGQAAVALAGHFDKIIATDASWQQIEHATRRDNVHYHVAPAEVSGIASDSVDLITIAQAIHWFDFDRFHAEVRRVAVDQAIVAAWTYGLTSITAEVDAIVQDFYTGEINPYWPPERSHIESDYRDIPFPYDQCTPTMFEMKVEWSARALLAYLRTWSSVKRFQADTGRDPVSKIAPAIHRAWGKGLRPVRWPLILKVGRVMRDA
ncbi:MAG: class I SAM-dependent methyltransferase [Verrucomicrobiales bacterium]